MLCKDEMIFIIGLTPSSSAALGTPLVQFTTLARHNNRRQEQIT